MLGATTLERGDPLSSRARARHLCLRCAPDVGRIAHGRYVVVDREPTRLASGALLHLDGYRVLTTPTVADDLRAVGAITLHGLLSSVADHGVHDDLDDEDADVDALTEVELERIADPRALTVRMLDALAEVARAGELWPRLDALCETLSRALRAGVTVVDAESELALVPDGPALPLRLHARQLTKQLLETTPGARLLLRRAGNSAVFLLLVHFALACTQRRDALPAALATDAALRPFCGARERPQDEGPAAAALAWIEPLLPALEPARARALFEDFESALDLLSEPAARGFAGRSPVHALWSQLERARGKLSKKTHELLRRGSEERELRERAGALEGALTELRAEKDDLEFKLHGHAERKRQFETELKRIERKLRDRGSENRQLEAKLKASLTVARRLTSSYSDARGELEAWRDHSQRVLAALQRLERIPLLNLRDQGSAREALYSLLRAPPRAGATPRTPQQVSKDISEAIAGAREEAGPHAMSTAAPPARATAAKPAATALAPRAPSPAPRRRSLCPRLSPRSARPPLP
ncbi:MAG: hypothetical protein H6713_16805 [Myxococcales bacterium]|nr:hypothetical protein [Myxococcales bacterium]